MASMDVPAGRPVAAPAPAKLAVAKPARIMWVTLAFIGFVPPSQFENGSTAAYVGVILGGTVLIGLLPAWLFLRFQKPSWKTSAATEEATS